MKKLVSIIMMILFASCGPQIIDDQRVNMMVNSHTVDCTGEREGTCLLVQEGNMIGTEDWDYFYYIDSIEGFIYEPGFLYGLNVKKTEVENPPADGSSIRYELVRIVTKTPVNNKQ